VFEIVDAWDGKDASVFTTGEEQARRDEYFLGSGDTIRCFWEEKAKGDASVPKRESVNKVGHALHRLEPVFRSVSLSARVEAICRSVGMARPVVPQSMAILKPRRTGGAVTPHQDGTFLYTEPQTVLGFWWALDDATEENGCLWAALGSHKTVPIQQRFRRDGAGGTEFVDAVPAPQRLTDHDGTPLPVKAGDLVLIHSAVVHWSAPNTSDMNRMAYSIHAVDATAHYPRDNWLLRADGSTAFPGFAGDDIPTA
jgi:phytanoyl-CoA hydroxylase